MEEKQNEVKQKTEQEIERKVIKTRRDLDLAADDQEIKKKLDLAMSEHEKVSKLVDYFVLGLFLVVIMYTML